MVQALFHGGSPGDLRTFLVGFLPRRGLIPSAHFHHLSIRCSVWHRDHRSQVAALDNSGPADSFKLVLCREAFVEAGPAVVFNISHAGGSNLGTLATTAHINPMSQNFGMSLGPGEVFDLPAPTEREVFTPCSRSSHRLAHGRPWSFTPTRRLKRAPRGWKSGPMHQEV